MSAGPHKFPIGAPAEVLAWRCGACGEWISEFGPRRRNDCPVNWRKQPLHERLHHAVAVVLDRED